MPEPVVLTKDDSIPLSLAALCCDCECVFFLGRLRCPRCDSGAWIPLETFFKEKKP